MPLYEYRCTQCGSIVDHHVPMDSRLDPQACLDCPGQAELHITAPLIGSERLTPAKRVIVAEEQVVSEKGERWRDEGTTGQPGGVGRKLIMH